MKKKKWLVLPLFIASIRFLPAFSGFWRECISLPLLRILRQIGSFFPFCLLEVYVICFAFTLIAAFGVEFGLKGVRIAFTRLVKRCTRLLLAALAMYLGIWYPLYFEEIPIYNTDCEMLVASCGILIDRLNEAELDFSFLPELPAKFVHFPAWMHAADIAGFCSFFTGEALVSPELENCVLPFVAMHERMHLEGHAGEGAANIAAWDACIIRGGVWADSARLWALRYSMGNLRRMDDSLYSDLLHRMDGKTYALYLQAGGSWNPAKPSLFAEVIYKLLGIQGPVQDYDILATCLAAAAQQ